MSEPRHFSHESSLPPYTPVAETLSLPHKETTYQELGSTTTTVQEPSGRKSEPKRSTRNKGKKDEMAESWTKAQVVNERYEATLNFLQGNNLLDVTMKAVELEKRDVMIKKKMEQLRGQNS